MAPPDPMPNSEVKRHIADGSVGLPHVRVGHRQALKETENPRLQSVGGFLCSGWVEARFLPQPGSARPRPPSL